MNIHDEKNAVETLTAAAQIIAKKCGEKYATVTLEVTASGEVKWSTYVHGCARYEHAKTMAEAVAKLIAAMQPQTMAATLRAEAQALINRAEAMSAKAERVEAAQ